MSLQINPRQVERRRQLTAFFDRGAMAAKAERTSNIPESPSQKSRREFKENFFEPKAMRKSSLQQVADAFVATGGPTSRIFPVTGGKTKNEAKLTGEGFLIFQDCDGAEVFRLGADNGIFLESDQIIQTGCDDSSSYPV